MAIIELQRPVRIYRLWLVDELMESMTALAGDGWQVSLTTAADDDGVKSLVTFKHRERRNLASAKLSDLIIVDWQSVESMSRTDFLAANPAVDLDM